jgi:hypothetical protein
MPKKRYKPEEIVAKLREVDVLVSPDSHSWLRSNPRGRDGGVRKELATGVKKRR